MGRYARQGESPVNEMGRQERLDLSTAGHEESGRKDRGPSRKAKYSTVTDREQVP